MPTLEGFPVARPDREVPPSSSPVIAGPSIAVPTVRLWPFIMRDTGPNERATVVSPFFTGPAVIDSWTLFTSVRSGPPLPSFTMLYSTDASGQGTAQLNTSRPSGVVIFENVSIADEPASGFVGPPGVVGNPLTGGNIFVVLPLRYPVLLSNFTLKVTMTANVAAEEQLQGYVRVLENVPPEQIANFL